MVKSLSECGRAATVAAGVAPALVASALVAGCGGSVKTVNPSGAATLVTRLASPKPTTVSCRRGVAAKVGNKLTCEVSYANGDQGRVAVTVVSTHGSKATLTIAGASALRIDFIGAKAAEEYLRSNIRTNTGSTGQVSAITCANNTPDVVGHLIPCQVVFRDGDRYRVTVHVANVRGGVFASKGDVHRVR